jgi:hypothetical protein
MVDQHCERDRRGLRINKRRTLIKMPGKSRKISGDQNKSRLEYKKTQPNKKYKAAGKKQGFLTSNYTTLQLLHKEKKMGWGQDL